MATSDRSELGRVGGYETSFVVHEDALAKTWLAQSIEPLAEEQASVELTRIGGELGRREELQRALKREVEAAAVAVEEIGCSMVNASPVDPVAAGEPNPSSAAPNGF